MIAGDTDKKVLKMSRPTRRILLKVIQRALDCQNHFHKPNLKRAWMDKDFKIDFDKSIVICDQCVKEMRKALQLTDEAHPLEAPELKEDQ